MLFLFLFLFLFGWSSLSPSSRCRGLCWATALLSASSQNDGSSIHPDIRAVVDVVGISNPGGRSWADSYSVGDRCYCSFSKFDNGRASFLVQLPPSVGSIWLPLPEVCALLGPGPGIVNGVTPLYNDVQCGNGPPNSRFDEHSCPGRVDIGPRGCGHVGPRWNFSGIATARPSRVLPGAERHADVRAVLDGVVGANPGGRSWADSYSVGNKCYCSFSTFDHGIGTYMVEVPRKGGGGLAWMTVEDVCDRLGPGPGIQSGVTPLYNDVQCGNGPPNDAGDEHTCPGRVDIGRNGCGHIGPKWNFETAVPCFPGNAVVTVKDARGEIRMDELRLGDEVLVDHKGTYSVVYSFGHYAPNTVTDYLHFRPSGLQISEDHMLVVVDNDGDRTTIPASSVEVGKSIEAHPTDQAVVQEIQTVRRKGAYAPFTLTGTMIVDGVQVSCYITMQPGQECLRFFGWQSPISQQWLAHASQAIHRLRVRVWGVAKSEEYTDEGLSVWIDQPYHVGRTVLSDQSSPGIRVLCLLFILPILAVVYLIEALICVPSLFGS